MVFSSSTSSTVSYFGGVWPSHMAEEAEEEAIVAESVWEDLREGGAGSLCAATKSIWWTDA